jgi:hypothetical protein
MSLIPCERSRRHASSTRRRAGHRLTLPPDRITCGTTAAHSSTSATRSCLSASPAVLLVLLELILCGAREERPGAVHGGVTTLLRPKLQIALLATTYLTTLLAAWFVFPHLWQRRFLDGIELALGNRAQPGGQAARRSACCLA